MKVNGRTVREAEQMAKEWKLHFLPFNILNHWHIFLEEVHSDKLIWVILEIWVNTDHLRN